MRMYEGMYVICVGMYVGLCVGMFVVMLHCLQV